MFVADFALQQKNKRQLCDTMKAIILSAGQGRRLLPLTRRRPKCLINLSGISILEWQLFALREAGVEEVVVVTGFAAEAVEKAVHQAGIRSMRVRQIGRASWRDRVCM